MIDRFTEDERAKLRAADLDPDEIEAALARLPEPVSTMSVVCARNAPAEPRRLWARVDRDSTPWRSERYGPEGDYDFAAWTDLVDVVVFFDGADVVRDVP